MALSLSSLFCRRFQEGATVKVMGRDEEWKEVAEMEKRKGGDNSKGKVGAEKKRRPTYKERQTTERGREQRRGGYELSPPKQSVSPIEKSQAEGRRYQFSVVLTQTEVKESRQF